MATLIIGGTGDTGLKLAKLLTDPAKVAKKRVPKKRKHKSGRDDPLSSSSDSEDLPPSYVSVTKVYSTGSVRRTTELVEHQPDRAQLLKRVLLTSRYGVAPGEPFKVVKFDWSKPSTFENPFKANPKIDRVYLIAPRNAHPGPIVKPFIDLAISKGVRRFVLLGRIGQTSRDISTGEVQKLLEESGVDYAILKATWFQENFGSYLFHADSIIEENVLYSCVGDGLLSFVSTRDIAQAAFDCLRVKKLGKKELTLLGPQLLTYDDAAKMLSGIIGREITHIKLTPEQMKERYTESTRSEELSDLLVSLEQEARAGGQERLFKKADRNKKIGKHLLLGYFKEYEAVGTWDKVWDNVWL